MVDRIWKKLYNRIADVSANLLPALLVIVAKRSYDPFRSAWGRRKSHDQCWFVLLLLVSYSCSNPEPVYLYSPDSTQCYTFLEYSGDPYKYAVVPGRWDSLQPPKENYMIIRYSDDFTFDVNWCDSVYRFAYGAPLENCLEPNVKFSEELHKSEGVEINNKHYYYNPPCIEGYSLGDILNNRIEEERALFKKEFKRIKN